MARVNPGSHCSEVSPAQGGAALHLNSDNRPGGVEEADGRQSAVVWGAGVAADPLAVGRGVRPVRHNRKIRIKK